MPPQDHVAIAVAVGGRPKIGRVLAKENLDQFMGIDKIGVRMTAAKIFKRHTAAHGARRGSQAVLKQGAGVGTGHRVH